ncbi:MAG TPA: MBL fold metallo-hydrolase [Candidatus Bathyarchaeota archaeon]|mgnify:CR=1 FL=1|nr:MAG: hypothetical protein DRO60_00925 [Candidatus Bathyarchaeota archaeon]HDJ26048.1 MBL fold metallo-hydrolase [Candidatus Bathyarchaeota archaeon]
MTIKLCFFGGVEGEVGGNQVLLQAGENKLLLDFGCNFSRWRRFFVFPVLMPREAADYFRVGLVQDELREPGSDHVRSDIDACFISHAHTDHYDAICTLKPGEGGHALYVGETAYLLMKARYARARRRPVVERARELLDQNARTFRTGTRLELDDVGSVPWHVDHSVPGSYAFILDTPDGVIVYTGDFRLHGSFSQAVEKQFWEAALDVASETRQGRVRALICEGTNMELANPLTEEDVRSMLLRCMRSCNGLVIVNTSSYDVDRLRTLHNVASEVGRTLVAPESFSYALEALKGDVGLKDLPEVGRDVLPYSDVKDELKAEQDRFVLLTAFFREREIIEVEPMPGSYFILSSSEPFEEESEIEFERLKNWLELFGVPIYRIHASGHAHPHHIREVIEALRPEVVLPIHTPRPYLFARHIKDVVASYGGRVVVPKRGQEIEL